MLRLRSGVNGSLGLGEHLVGNHGTQDGQGDDGVLGGNHGQAHVHGRRHALDHALRQSGVEGGRRGDDFGLTTGVVVFLDMADSFTRSVEGLG